MGLGLSEVNYKNRSLIVAIKTFEALRTILVLLSTPQNLYVVGLAPLFTQKSPGNPKF